MNVGVNHPKTCGRACFSSRWANTSNRKSVRCLVNFVRYTAFIKLIASVRSHLYKNTTFI